MGPLEVHGGFLGVPEGFLGGPLEIHERSLGVPEGFLGGY